MQNEENTNSSEEVNSNGCSKCGSIMELMSRKSELAECDMDDMTDGQRADYMAAKMSGDYGDWSIIVETYKCPKCEATLIIEYI